MFKKNKDLEKYIADSVHHVVFDCQTGRVVYASKNIQKKYLTNIEEPTFDTFFPNLNFEDIKRQISEAPEKKIKLNVNYQGYNMPFEFSKIEIGDRDKIMVSLLVEQVFFGTFGEKFSLVRRQDLFITAYIDDNYNIVGCSHMYKKYFKDASPKLIGANIYHNIINYRPYEDVIRLRQIIEEHYFWYGVAVLKERDNIFAPYIVVVYNRVAPILDSKFEVHFFPLRFFGDKTIFQYDFHSGRGSSVYSRSIFEGIVHKYLAADDTEKYLLFMDINNFKSINDFHGHDCGDYVLRKIAEILSHVFKDYIVSRHGGDEFAVYIDRPTPKEKIIELIETMESMIEEQIGDKFNATKNHLSVGISKYKENGTTLNDLIHEADVAMYKAKRENLLYKFCYD